MFIFDTITFQLNMTEFRESVFLKPLQSNRLTINLNPSKIEDHNSILHHIQYALIVIIFHQVQLIRW